MRGGFGIFYFLDRGGVGNQLSNNPGFNGLQTYTAANGYRITFTGQNSPGSGNNNATTATQALPLPVFGAASITPTLIANSSLIAEDLNNQNGDVEQYNIQVQHQLDRYTSLDIAYVGNRSEHLATFYNRNAPQLGSGAAAFANRNTITEDTAGGVGHYSGLQVFANRNVGNNLLVTGASTYSHTLDNSNGAFSTGASASGARFFIASGQSQFRLNYGNSDQDQRHVFVGSVIYNLPYGHGQHFGANAPLVLQEILGGWQANSLTTVDGGTPFDINVSGIGNIDNRADVLSYAHLPKGLHSGTAYTNNINYFSGIFAPPPMVNGNYQRAGNADRNQFFGPGFTSEDFGLFKDFIITEQVKFQFRAQAYNLFNHPHFANPDSNIHDGTALANGTYTAGSGTQFGTISGTRGDPRELELAARINF